jgi:hypothetical protein
MKSLAPTLAPTVALATLLFAAAGSAQETTKPIRYTWMATSCETWNCAASALVLADGSPDVIILPTKDTDRPWIVLRRVEEGSIFIPDDEPFLCEVFSGMTDATARFMATGDCHAPLVLNLPDGRAAMASLRECGGNARRRAVR